MKIVLFDLGRTLEKDDVLLPGAAATLAAIQGLVDGEGRPVEMGLVSDFDMPRTPDEVPAIRRSYDEILDALGIRQFFEPVERRVTLSSDVGVFKPDARVFRAALDRLAPDLPHVVEIRLDARWQEPDLERLTQLGVCRARLAACRSFWQAVGDSLIQRAKKAEP